VLITQWANVKPDTNLVLQLQDLAAVLSDQPHINFEYSYGSLVDIVNHKVTASTIWDIENQNMKKAGLKSDVFLRSIGTIRHSNIQALKAYLKNIHKSRLTKFSTQLVALFEDIRLEEIIKMERPGTTSIFEMRKKFLKHYFETQLTANITRSNQLDELFCLIYLLIQSNQPDPLFPRANKQQLQQLDSLKPLIYNVFEATKTTDITNTTEQIVSRLDPFYQDSINEYFTFPIAHIEHLARNTLFDELTRTDPLANDDQEAFDEEKSDYVDEKFSTWHREGKNEDIEQTFLQFELEQGTKTSLIGDGARDTEEGDQAMASIQGTSGESKQQDYSKLEALDKKDANKGSQLHENIYGVENKDAVKIIKHAESPSILDIEAYNEFVLDIEPFKRKLATTIEKTLEHKQNEQRGDLTIGRLSKNLLPLVIDENSRVFYKKNHESTEIDAVFTLLIDCSASMHNKMDETKRGIVLFHEVLNRLKIPHSIVGFWEDANEVKANYQPNYFHIIHSHSDLFYKNNGAKIMQLEPQEDNRDGYSIRVMTNELMARREKSKFLLVFSDGEPAATNYDKNGIIDTHEAVIEARKRGIDVIGMFLATGEINESEDLTMKNIYGKQRLMIPSVSELPEHFTPLLKRLLLKAI
jgi:nitric oxide reductase activation protein